MNIFILAGLAAALAGCASIYLASPNQRWCEGAWPAWPARLAGIVLLALSWLAFWQSMQAIAASFAFATVLMLLLALLPYIGALIHTRRIRT